MRRLDQAIAVGLPRMPVLDPAHHPDQILADQPAIAVNDMMLHRIASLPRAVTAALVLVAVAGTGAEQAVRAALETAAGDVDVLLPAEERGLIELGPGLIRFPHPVIRELILEAAAPAELRNAHQLLAGGTLAPLTRAWHLSEATIGPDASVAEAVGDVARLAMEAGRHAHAAEAFERAATLSGDATPRG